MKKTFLSLMLVAVSASAAFAATDYKQTWSASVASMESSDLSFTGVTTVDASGNLIASSVFDKSLTLGSNTYEPIGKSSYIAKYDATGAMKWSVPMIGAATVTAMTTDAEGNLYAAGTFADEVEFGTTSGSPVVKAGAMIMGAYSKMQDASFVATYTADGVLKNVVTFVPEALEAIAAMAFPEPGDIFFRINSLAVDADKNLYGSAVYTGKTTVGNAVFESSYDDVWMGGFYFMHLKAASVFKISNAGDCSAVATLGYTGPQASMDNQYQVLSGTMTYADGNIFAAFSGSGPLKLSTAADSKVFDIPETSFNYYLAQVNPSTGSLSQVATMPGAEASMGSSTYIVKKVLADNANYIVAGYENFAKTEGETTREGIQMFVTSVSKSEIATAAKSTVEVTDGAVNFYNVNAATVADGGELLLGVSGYYTSTEPTPDPKPEGWQPAYRNGDFAKAVKGYRFSAGNFTADASLDGAVSLAANKKWLAKATAAESGVAYTLLSAGDSALDIIGVDANAPEEYFNLQGVRVAKPAKGNIYLVRKGNSVRKILM